MRIIELKVGPIKSSLESSYANDLFASFPF